jgi:hypothetical protein
MINVSRLMFFLGFAEYAAKAEWCVNKKIRDSTARPAEIDSPCRLRGKR